MPVSRRRLLKQLARMTDADREETTTTAALASALDTDVRTVKTHLSGLEACNLARTDPGGTARVTVTGEEFLKIDPDEAIIVDASPRSSEK